MKKNKWLHPVNVVGVLLLLGGGVLMQPVVAFLGLLVWLVGMIWVTQTDIRNRYRNEEVDDLSMEAKARMAPLRKHVRDIESWLEAHQSDAVAAAVGKEAVDEAHKLRSAVAASLRVRDKAFAGIEGQTIAQRRLKQLETELGAAEGETKERLQESLASTQQELEHYSHLRATAEKIEGDVSRAESALGELKSRLTVRGVKAEEVEDVRSRLGQLQAVSKTLEEVDSLFETSESP